MDVIDASQGVTGGSVYSGPSFADLSQAASGAGITIPDTPTPDPSAFSLAYWQQKAGEFQATLNALDSGYSAAVAVLNSPDALAADPTLGDDLSAQLADFDSKKTALRLTAEAINGGAQVVQSLGGTFQSLNIPGTLGVVPLIPVAAIGAFAVAATLIAWGVTWLGGLNQRLLRAQTLAAAGSPAAQVALAQGYAQSDNALQAAQGTSFSTIAAYVQWGGIALLAYLAWRAVNGSKTLRRYLDTD